MGQRQDAKAMKVSLVGCVGQFVKGKEVELRLLLRDRVVGTLSEGGWRKLKQRRSCGFNGGWMGCVGKCWSVAGQRTE